MLRRDFHHVLLIFLRGCKLIQKHLEPIGEALNVLDAKLALKGPEEVGIPVP